MKTIGIATWYTNSCNYGGVLQAYALCRILNERGYKAEQIKYFDSGLSISDKIKTLNSKNFMTILYNGYCFKLLGEQMTRTKNNIIGRIYKSNKQIETLQRSFKEFRDRIPHTKCEYNRETLNECDYFDIYITGSDQVWRIGISQVLNPFFWLKFVEPDKIKLSYAASFSTKQIPYQLYGDVQDTLSTFKAISVREIQDKELLFKVINDKKVQWVLDPTLLLSRRDWDCLCDDNPYKKEKYVFAYLLGDNKKQRQFIERWAKLNNAKVISIPYLLGHYRSCDRKFGDIRKSDVTPNLWLSLIRDALCVFTDSFHATAFSCTFQTPFYIFKRSDDKETSSMNSRIYSLTKLLNTESRIINDNESIDSIPAIDDIDFNNVQFKIDDERKKSLEFLINAIE